jgi:hypothetical protein
LDFHGALCSAVFPELPAIFALDLLKDFGFIIHSLRAL